MEAPKIYNYHPQSFEYLSDGLADISPMEEGKWLFPAFSTLKKPPQLKPNQNALFLFEQQQWQVVDDFRGEIWYQKDGEKVIITSFGDPTILGYMPQPPEKIDEYIYAVLTARQMRLLLRKLDKLTLVQELINRLPSPKKEDAQIEWDYGAYFDYQHFLIQDILNSFNIDKDNFNQLWLEFSKI